MRKKLTNNWHLKLISLGLAVLLWLVVLSIEDPVYTKEITDIPITEINADKITDEGKAYSYIDGNTVTIRVRGKTSIMSRLTKNDFLAVADLSTMSITGAVNVDVSCPRYPSIEITPIGSSTVLKVEIEDLVEKAFNVKVITNGEGPKGKYVSNGVATPNMVTISGPLSVVSNINEAVVYVNITDANTSDITTNVNLVLLDMNQNEVDTSSLDISKTSISVLIPILDTKLVPIDFSITGKVADGYDIVSSAFEPKEVEIAGKKEALDKINSVMMKNYDVTDFTESVEDSLIISQNLLENLPSGCEFYNVDDSLAVVVNVEPVIERRMELPVSKISLVGNSSAYIYEKGTDKIGGRVLRIPLKGTENAVNQLTADDLSAVVDVSGYGPGTYELPVEVHLKNGIELSETVSVVISITESFEE